MTIASKMKFSDTTQEYYRELSKKEKALTKSFLESNYSAYTFFDECKNEDDAFGLIENIIIIEPDLAYAWAKSIGTLTVTGNV